MSEKEIKINQLQPNVMNLILERLKTYTIGFLVYNGEEEEFDDVKLFGSGTLVQIGSVYAVVSCHHVVDALPQSGRLGLLVLPTAQRYTVDIHGLEYIKIARGEVDSDGPDLAAIVLSASLASTIGAVKSFYNIDNYREATLTSPPSLRKGIWVNIGFVDEVTRTEEAQGKFTSIKNFGMLGGFGGPSDEPYEIDIYDYLSLPIKYGSSNDIPNSFGGMSGGGLWQVELNGEFYPKKYWFSGVVFYQNPTNNGKGSILCHFRKTVFNVVYEKLANKP